jgi:hypothetical protein
MAADTYTARDQTAAGTQAAPPLLNEIIGDPLQRATNVGTRGDTGQVGQATGGTDRPNDPSDND